MRYRSKPNNMNELLNDIESEINEKGMKNGVFILLGENDEISLTSAHDDSVQIAGIMELGKTFFNNEVLSDED